MVNTDMQLKIQVACDSIKAMLLEKNEAYGNSALDPLRIFSKADSVVQLKVRIDDKLSRIFRGNCAGEDTIRDLIGYLVLLLIAEEQRAAQFPIENKICARCGCTINLMEGIAYLLKGEDACRRCFLMEYPEPTLPKQEAPKPETTAQKAEVPPAISTAFTQEEVEMVKKVMVTCGGIKDISKATGFPLRKVNQILKAIGKEA